MVGPGRSWSPPADNSPAVSFLHGLRAAVIKTDDRGKMTEGPGMQQWNKGPRRKTAATSEEGEDIRQDLQEDRRAGDRKANSRVFDWPTGSE
jgi:hypothetical protein